MQEILDFVILKTEVDLKTSISHLFTETNLLVIIYALKIVIFLKNKKSNIFICLFEKIEVPETKFFEIPRNSAEVHGLLRH
jgi:hypothetical protein